MMSDKSGAVAAAWMSKTHCCKWHEFAGGGIGGLRSRHRQLLNHSTARQPEGITGFACSLHASRSHLGVAGACMRSAGVWGGGRTAAGPGIW